MIPTKAKRRQVKNLMSKSVNVFKGHKSLDEITHTETPLEADLCYHFEYDPKIIRYQAQPLSFRFFNQSQVHVYNPDFEVFYDDETICYFEVKYIEDIKRIKGFEKWENSVRKAAKAKGKGFIVLNEDFIRQQYLYENLQTLYCASEIPINKEFVTHIIQTLDHKNEVYIYELLKSASIGNEFEQVYRLIFDHKLLTPLTSDFISTSSIVKHSGESYDCYL